MAHGQFKELEPAIFMAIYNLKSQKDSLNPFRIRNENMILLSGQKHSLFIPYGVYFVDSVLRKNSSITFQLLIQQNIIRRFHQFQIHKNFLTHQMTIFDRVFVDLFVFKIPNEKIRRRLTEETGEILGYSMQKATTQFGGRKWEAWFTQEIPHGDGPYKFSGLPGLILKIQDTRKHFVFEIESISPSTETIYMRRKSSAIVTTKAQFI
ncbi:MAG TPA: hypothetical protein DCM62_05065 [Bacteroidales bacterium]|nr:hypothetical protein [Bacteroidales bacterium]